MSTPNYYSRLYGRYDELRDQWDALKREASERSDWTKELHPRIGSHIEGMPIGYFNKALGAVGFREEGHIMDCCGAVLCQTFLIVPNMDLKTAQAKSRAIEQLCIEATEKIAGTIIPAFAVACDVASGETGNATYNHSPEYDTRLFCELGGWFTDATTVRNRNGGNFVQLWWLYNSNAPVSWNRNYVKPTSNLKSLT